MTAILDSNQCCRFCGPTPKPLGQWQLYIFCGSCRIRTYGTFRFAGFQDQCNRPTLPNFQLNYISCGSRRIRTFGTFRFGTLAVCWFKPLTHTSIQGIWYFNCCSLLQLISYFNDMIQQ